VYVCVYVCVHVYVYTVYGDAWIQDLQSEVASKIRFAFIRCIFNDQILSLQTGRCFSYFNQNPEKEMWINMSSVFSLIKEEKINMLDCTVKRLYLSPRFLCVRRY
jgi:hypothetical protein